MLSFPVIYHKMVFNPEANSFINKVIPATIFHAVTESYFLFFLSIFKNQLLLSSANFSVTFCTILKSFIFSISASSNGNAKYTLSGSYVHNSFETGFLLASKWNFTSLFTTSRFTEREIRNLFSSLFITHLHSSLPT